MIKNAFDKAKPVAPLKAGSNPNFKRNNVSLSHRITPKAPPVYRPNPIPRVLQSKVKGPQSLTGPTTGITGPSVNRKRLNNERAELHSAPHGSKELPRSTQLKLIRPAKFPIKQNCPDFSSRIVQATSRKGKEKVTNEENGKKDHRPSTKDKGHKHTATGGGKDKRVVRNRAERAANREIKHNEIRSGYVTAVHEQRSRRDADRKNRYLRLMATLSRGAYSAPKQMFTIMDSTGEDTEVPSVRVTPEIKSQMREAYIALSTKQAEGNFYFHFKTGAAFEIAPGTDYVAKTLVPEGRPYTYKRPQSGTTYTKLARKADEAASHLLSKHSDKYGSTEEARARVGRDINNEAGGRPKVESYPMGLLPFLSEFAIVIRCDKARVPEATPYIERVLKDGSKSFADRFGGNTPVYLGTGEQRGVTRGVAGLRGQVSDDNYDSDYES